MNALDNVVLPGINETIHHIESELDELEREEIFRYFFLNFKITFRLKKVLQNKTKNDQKNAEDIRKFQESMFLSPGHETLVAASQESTPHEASLPDASSNPKNILDQYNESDDEDIIF